MTVHRTEEFPITSTLVPELKKLALLTPESGGEKRGKEGRDPELPLLPSSNKKTQPPPGCEQKHRSKPRSPPSP